MGAGGGGCDLVCQWIILCGCNAAGYFSAIAVVLYRLARDGKKLSIPALQKITDLTQQARDIIEQQSEIVSKLYHRPISINVSSLNDIAFQIQIFSQVEGFTREEGLRMVYLAHELIKIGEQISKVILIDMGMDPNTDIYTN